MSEPAWAKALWALDRGEGPVRRGLEDQRYLSRGGGGDWDWRVVPSPPSKMRIGGLEGGRSESDIFMAGEYDKLFTASEMRWMSDD